MVALQAQADTTYEFAAAAGQVDPACDISECNLVKVVCRGFPHAALSVRAPAYSVPCSIILR